jgi:predicted enzyme related to lactoylglutathione lyase
VIDRVGPAGGNLVMGKSGSDEGGYVAFFVDTEGNRVGLTSHQ